ncbi:MAG: T9SS type A sorting domain-containing protein, partial [Candidatus Pelagibacter sp.]|nr:T9SS type A sorting domain-containing protein [Candidatus Pelagibacter sp.]
SSNYGSSWGNNTWGNYIIYSLNKFGPLVVAGGNQIVYSTNLGDNWKTTSGAYGDQWSVLASNPTEIFAGQRSFSLSPTVHIGVWKSSLLNLIDTTANLDENHISSNLSIYPNPTTDKLNLSFTSKNAKRISIRLLNLLGSEVFTDDIKIFSGNYTTIINLSNNKKGIYFLEITTNLGVSSKKIILQ